ncbi:MAG: hypothetical protein ACWGSQ_16830 [Longimicrobiales bacterium]
MGKKVEKVGNAERLLALHDELDVLDRKESFVALSVVLFVIAGVLIVLGMSRGNVYLEVNGLFLSFGGVIFGVKEVSKRRRMKALARRVAEIEEAGRGAGDQGALGGSGERPALDASG